MMTRAEKLFNIRAQVAKAASDIDHGDTYGACLALGDALGAVLTFLEEEHEEVEALTKLVEELHSPFQHRADERQKEPIHPVGEEVKEALPAKTKMPRK
jgi:methyl coenzyme M reductase subunit C-like uncharacterized protein (methanogenesis marker protein 7)